MTHGDLIVYHSLIFTKRNTDDQVKLFINFLKTSTFHVDILCGDTEVFVVYL